MSGKRDLRKLIVPKKIGVGGPWTVEGTVRGSAPLVGFVIGFTMFVMPLISAAAHEGPRSEEEARNNPWQLLLRKQAREYSVNRLRDNRPQPAELVPHPLTLWAQPVRGGDQGAVFLWAHDTEPVLIGTLFLWPRDTGDRVVLVNAHELHTLSNDAVQTEFGSTRWTAPAETVHWHAFPGESVRLDNRRMQSLQLRGLMKRLTAVRRDPTGDETHLRMLPKPLYEFPPQGEPASNQKDSFEHRDYSESAKVRTAGESAGETPGPTSHDQQSREEIEIPLQGAVWGFVDGTDLEIVVLARTLPDEEGKLRWHFMAARMSDRPLRVAVDDRDVWHVGHSRHGSRSGPYFISNVGEWDPVSGLEQ